jgi:hypothetical protein
MEKVIRKGLLCFVLILSISFSFGQGSNITGNVLYHNMYPMDNVDAFLYSDDGTLISSTTTNSAGLYQFTNIPDGDYSITFSTDEQPGGVTLTDAYLVMLHLFNMYPFTSFQEMVADVNGSGSVTWNDYFEILISYLNQGNPFSGGDWVFLPVEFTLPGGNRDVFTTSGGSNGDVNGTFQPPKYGNCFVDSNSPAESIQPNEESIIQLDAQEVMLITGMHLVFQVPEGITVNSISSPLSDIHYNHDGSEIRVTWMNDGLSVMEIEPTQAILEFSITANDRAEYGEPLTISLLSASHFIGETGEMLPFVNLSLPGIMVEETTALAVRETIYPNPFLSYATLEYELPSDGDVKILVTNSAGQVIQVVKDEFQIAGSYNTRIDGTNWPTGIYQYCIYFSGSSTIMKSGSMIKSK